MSSTGQRNRDHILDAAAAALRSRSDVSMDAVAAHAKVGRATAYRHFRDVDAIHEALVAEAIDEGKRVLRAHLTAGAGARGHQPAIRKRLLDAVEELVRADARWTQSVASRSPAADQLADTFAPVIAAVFRRAQSRGEMRSDIEVEANALAFMALITCAINAVQRRRLTPEHALQPVTVFLEALG